MSQFDIQTNERQFFNRLKQTADGAILLNFLKRATAHSANLDNIETIEDLKGAKKLKSFIETTMTPLLTPDQPVAEPAAEDEMM